MKFSSVAASVVWFNLAKHLLTDYYYYLASAAVAVDSGHVTASSSTLWSRFSPPSYFVNGHMSTMWFMVCCWPQSQEGNWARPHLCKLARLGPWPVWKRFIGDSVWRRRSKPDWWHNKTTTTSVLRPLYGPLPVKNWRILLVQSFTARIPLLTATSAD